MSRQDRKARLRTLDEVELANKRVLVRLDLNVPIEDGKVADATRIKRSVPTLREIAEEGGKAILLSHFGRPEGPDDKNSLRQVVPAVAAALEISSKLELLGNLLEKVDVPTTCTC